MANVIRAARRPALVISHNKTLAAQLYAEFRDFFPHNAVHYFVSYYDYYQPEAYVPVTDTYIEKDADINDEIDRLRLRATASLLDRRDVVIVASVSCIYGLGAPEDFLNQTLQVVKNPQIVIREMMRIGRFGIVGFPNFGYWALRAGIFFGGRAPKSPALPFEWYNTPNIHVCTVRDFEALCRERGIRILARDVVGNTEREPLLANAWPNLFATTAIYHITR